MSSCGILSSSKKAVEDLSENVRGGTPHPGFPEGLKDAIKNFEREHILRIIKKYEFNKEEAAKALSIGLSSLYRKMEELGIPTKGELEVK